MRKQSTVSGLRRILAGGVSGALLLALTLPFSLAVSAQPPNCETSGTTVEYLEESSNSTTWVYEVCQEGFGLSHWVLGVCVGLGDNIVEVGYYEADGTQVAMDRCSETTDDSPCWEFGTDPTTGLYGLKWDNLPGPENECWTFYFVLDVERGEDTLQWSSKYAACEPEYGTVTGPACEACSEILAFKYVDTDGNGEYNDGDIELEGWEMCLSAQNGTQLACNLTGPNGFVTFCRPEAGNYTVCEEEPSANWTTTQPSDGYCYNVTVEPGGQVLVRFGNEPTEEQTEDKAYVRGTVCCDFDGDGECYECIGIEDPPCPECCEPRLNGHVVCIEGPGIEEEDECRVTSDICLLAGGCTGYWELQPGEEYTLTYHGPQLQSAGTSSNDATLSRTITAVAGEFQEVSFASGECETPPPPPVSVGGEAVGVDRGRILLWVALTGLASLALLGVASVRLYRRIPRR